MEKRRDGGRSEQGPADGDLVVAARDGSSAAVRALYDRHAGAVRFVIRDRIRDADLVEELVQETFTRTLERLDSLREPSRYRPWLLSIARNVANDRWRLEHRQVDVETELLDLEPSSGTSPEDDVAQRELAELVGNGLAELPQRDALALALVTYLDMSPSEVAVALGVTANSAKVVVHRARRRLRAILVADALDADAAAACPTFRGLPDRFERRRHVGGCDDCVTAARSRLDGHPAMHERPAVGS